MIEVENIMVGILEDNTWSICKVSKKKKVLLLNIQCWAHHCKIVWLKDQIES